MAPKSKLKKPQTMKKSLMAHFYQTQTREIEKQKMY